MKETLFTASHHHVELNPNWADNVNQLVRLLQVHQPPFTQFEGQAYRCGGDGIRVIDLSCCPPDRNYVSISLFEEGIVSVPWFNEEDLRAEHLEIHVSDGTDSFHLAKLLLEKLNAPGEVQGLSSTVIAK